MSSADRDARNLGKYLDIEVSVLRGADRSWAVSKRASRLLMCWCAGWGIG